MRPAPFTRSLLPLAAVCLTLQLPWSLARADDPVDLGASASARALSADEIAAEPANLGAGLRQLSAAARKQGVAAQPDARRRATMLGAHRRVAVPRAQADSAGRVVADVKLTRGGSMEAVRAGLLALGAESFAEAPGSSGRPGGVLSVYLPPERAAEAARISGVHSIALVHRPWKRVGRATSQGVTTIKSDAANTRGFTGRGITVGVLSDSFDLVSPHAAADILNDDLPGSRNPAGHVQPVFVYREGDGSDSFNEDEGRALLQIIHDVAPDAALAFSAVGSSQTSFASAIRGLRTDSRARCDILVDDIAFPDEPFFSDGTLSQAVDDVVTRTDLPGRPVIFYSAAGNDGDVGYDAEFRPYADDTARAGGTAVGNLKLDQVPRELTAGGFHNFKGTLKGHGSGIVQRVTVTGGLAELDFQWNDAFGNGRATTDYNLLVFDESGNYLPGISGTDNSFATGDALEIVDLDTNVNGADRIYQLAISRRAGGSGQATRLRYVASTGGQFVSKYVRPGVPTIFGHSGARNVDSVGAFDVAFPKVPESYTSFGPITIYFDGNGNRLSVPEIRQQPTVSGPDGVDTSFFPGDAGSDTDGDGLPNFFGTSAAAPHVAGVAALMLQAAGGPGSLSPAQMRDLLTSTATPHDLDPNQSVARLGNGDGVTSVTLTATGDDSNNASFDPNFFALRYESGLENTSLRTVTVDLAAVSEQFDPSVEKGFPFVIGQALGVDPAAVTAAVSSIDGAPTPNSRLTLTFLPGSFRPGASLTFGLDRDTSAGSGGNSADFLNGAVVKVKFDLPDGTKGRLKGSLGSSVGAGFSPDVGYGIINAEAALNRLGR